MACPFASMDHEMPPAIDGQSPCRRHKKTNHRGPEDTEGRKHREDQERENKRKPKPSTCGLPDFSFSLFLFSLCCLPSVPSVPLWFVFCSSLFPRKPQQ